MTVLTNHTIGIAHRNGYGRCGTVPVWNSALHDAGRVVLFPHLTMDKQKGKRTPKRTRYVVDFTSYAVWATEDESVEHLAYELLGDCCTEVCNVDVMEEDWYEELNDRYGNLTDLAKSLAGVRNLNEAAPELLKACKLALLVMESEKAAWAGCCDLFDNAIALCQKAIARAERD